MYKGGLRAGLGVGADRCGIRAQPDSNREDAMKLERIDDHHFRLSIDLKQGQKLAKAINGNARDMRNGALALSSILGEAYAQANNEFRQPPHAFDENAPRQPSIEK
jgi:hypothetical protein